MDKILDAFKLWRLHHHYSFRN